MAAGAAGGGGNAGAIRAGRAFVELFAQDNKLYRSLAAAEARVHAFGRATAKVGAGLFGLGAGAAGGGLAAVLGPITDTAKLSATAKAMGLTAEQFSGIAGVAGTTGEEVREFIESMVTLGKVTSEGLEGKGEVAADFFKTIGVSAQDFAALRPDEQFFRLFEALQTVQDPMKRTRALMTAFGEDGGKYLLPLLSKAPAELREMAAGLALTADEAAAAEAANAAYSRVTATLSTMWRKLATAAAPVVESVAGLLSKYLEPLSAWMSANRPVVEMAAKVFFGLAAGAAAVGAAMAVLGPAVAVVATVVSGVVTTIGGVVGGIAAVGSAIASAVVFVGALPAAFAAVTAAVSGLISALPVVLAAVAAGTAVFALGAAAVGGLVAAFLYLTDTGEAVRGVLAKVFAGDFAGAAADAAAGLRSAWGSVLGWLDDHLGDTFRNVAATWDAVVGAVSAGDLEGAASLAFDGLRVEWARLTLFMTEQWNGFKATFVDGFHSAVAAVSKALVDLTSRFKDEIGAVLARLGDLIALAPKTFARVGLDAAALDRARAGLAADPEKVKEGIDRRGQAAQAERDRSRAADADAARRDLAAEESRAASNRIDAEFEREMGKLARMWAEMESELDKPRPVPGADRPADIGKSITTFGGFRDVANELGGGGGVAKQQLNEQKNGNKLLAEVRDAIKNIPKGEWVLA